MRRESVLHDKQRYIGEHAVDDRFLSCVTADRLGSSMSLPPAACNVKRRSAGRLERQAQLSGSKSSQAATASSTSALSEKIWRGSSGASNS